MNRLHPMTLLFVLATTALTALVSCKPESSSTSAVTPESATIPDGDGVVFKDAATYRLFKSYIALKTALVKSDASAAKAAAAGIDSEVPAVTEATKAIAATGDLKAQRASFQTLVAALVPIFQQNLAGGRISIQHCPMAMGGKGADWISESTAIRNPYYGESMLECGEVTKSLTAGSIP
ncbi:MAG: DUF3347 domain-containing protein [Luteolibacter sp.]|uniref:DUF3347 domain-containing protein n=1 Tax=Luteolibacter sp. TaxID=1962973 RepID=UPI0032662688